ncbi:MAG TPA: hypothetical protein VGQ83_22630 [Polyangia bacterium]
MLGPDNLPRVTDLEVARGAAELAVLSALVHGRRAGGLAAVTTTLKAVRSSRRLDGELRGTYRGAASGCGGRNGHG